ncbi:hypothetical protein PC116_g23472 [Phytophthora cactorum]|nr:hypothetical protein Pcac1_g18950 [Phytophthora cactorum]KAG3136066.1 hypothetical protein C6341_g21529 [Phytophthora cactorum]KAG4228161.1 hypothetical protein PC116_g23472 [Phytophthora cactorum]
MVLSKEEFDMLQTFHRFVPLPALSSRNLRVYCEDDMQVPEPSHDEVEEESQATKPSDQDAQSSTSGDILCHPCP